MLVYAYVHDVTSTYCDQVHLTTNLSDDITNYCDMGTPIITTGNLNSRTGIKDEYYYDSQEDNIYIETNNTSIVLPDRKNCDLIHVFFIRKPFFHPRLNFLSNCSKMRLKFS